MKRIKKRKVIAHLENGICWRLFLLISEINIEEVESIREQFALKRRK